MEDRHGRLGARAVMNTARLLFAAGLIAVVAPPLAAQEAAGREGEPPPSGVVVAGYPSPAAAGALSLGTTVVPTVAGMLVGDLEGFIIAGTGVIFGPLSGYAYGGAMERGEKGLALRLFVAGGSTIAIVTMCQLGDCNFFDEGDTELSTAAFLAFFFGGAVLVGSSAIDMLSVPDHVRRANAARAAEETDVEVSVLPLLPTREHGLGVMARLRF